MPRRSIFSFSLRSPKPDAGPTHDQSAQTSPTDTASLHGDLEGDARYIPRQWQPNRLATLHVTPSEENLYLAAMASLDQPPPSLPLWADSAPQIPPHRQATPLDPTPPITAATRQRFNLPLSPKLVTSPSLPPEGLTVRDEFRSFAQLGPGTGQAGPGVGVSAGHGHRARHALVAFAEESTIRFHNFPHATLVQMEEELEVAWPRGFTRKQPTLDKLKDRSEETGHTWVVSLKGKVWRRAGHEELGTIRLVLALLTSLGMQGWQLVEKVQATGMRTDHHNLLLVQSQDMASHPPAFFAISIPLPDRISLISPPNKIIPALITAIRQAINMQDRHAPGSQERKHGGRGRSGSVNTMDDRRHSVVEWDAWKGGIKLEGFVHPGVYRFWIDGLRRWLSGAVKWNVVEKLHPPLILALINTLGAENFHLLTSLPLLPLQKGRDVLIFQSVPASGLSYLDSWRDIPSVPPSVSGSLIGRSLAGEAPVIISRDEAIPSRDEVLPAELQGGRMTRQRDAGNGRLWDRGSERGSDDHPRECNNAGVRPYADGRLKRHASVDSRPDVLSHQPTVQDAHNGYAHPHPHAADFISRTGNHAPGTTGTSTASGSSELPPRPMPVFDDHDRPLTPENAREAQAHAQRKRNVLTKKPSLKDTQAMHAAHAAQAGQARQNGHSHAGQIPPPQQQDQVQSDDASQSRPRRSFSFGRMRGYRKPSLKNNFGKGKNSAPPLASDNVHAQLGYGGLAGEGIQEAVHPRSRHGIGSDATGETMAMGTSMGGLGSLGGGDWSLVDLPQTQTGPGLGLSMYAPGASRRHSHDGARGGAQQQEHHRDQRDTLASTLGSPGRTYGNGGGSIQSPGVDEGEVDISQAAWAIKAPAHTTHAGSTSGWVADHQRQRQYEVEQQQQQDGQQMAPSASAPMPVQREISTPALPMPGAFYSSAQPPLTRRQPNVGERALKTRPSFDSGTSVSEYHDASDRPVYRTGSLSGQGQGRELHIANPTPPPQSLLSDRYPSDTNANFQGAAPHSYNDRESAHNTDTRYTPRAMPAPSPAILPLGTGLSIPNDNRASHYTYSSEPMTSAAYAPALGMPLGATAAAQLDVPLSPTGAPSRGRAHDGLIDRGSVFGVQSVAGSVGYMGGGASQSVLGLSPDRRSVQLPMPEGAGAGAGTGTRQQPGMPVSVPVPTPPMTTTAHTEVLSKGKSKEAISGQGQAPGQGQGLGQASQYATYVRDVAEGRDPRRYDANRGSMISVATGEAGPGPGSRRTKVQVG